MIYILIKTLITAAVVVAVSEIARRSSLFAGLIASIPLVSFLAIIWLYWETKNSQKIVDLSYSIILMIIPSLTFFIVLPFVMKLQSSFVISMIVATVSTIIAYWLFILLLGKFGVSI
jgi:hypothetical protein|tara:strand:- start:83 stop:433 length:351 start_codon:yes stop_codon:yes gene_type:complete